MSEGVIVALIAAGGSVAVTIVGGIFGLLQLRKHRKQAKEQSATLEVVRDQVQNSHGTNLRHDLDRVIEAVTRTEAAVGYVADEIKGIRKDIGRLDSRDLEDAADLRHTRDRLNRRIDDLERTIDPRKDKP